MRAMSFLEGFGVTDPASYQDVIGIDLGHGETSAALMHMGGDKPVDLRFDDNSKLKIVTALYIFNDDGDVLVGDDAVHANKSKGRLYTGFKDRPDRLGNRYEFDTRTKRELVQLFFTKVVELLFRCNPYILGDKKPIIFVGCPSSAEWLRHSREYAALLSEHIGIPVVIIPESRAAMIKVFRSPNDEFVANKGTVIFDSGSSTLDCTYIDPDGRLAFECSEPLGASLIERAMLRRVLKDRRPEDVKDITTATIALREKKENFFTYDDYDITCRVQFRDGGQTPYVPIDTDFMAGVVNGMDVRYATNRGPVMGSWSKLCVDFYSSVARRLREKPLETIVLTGGASRMPLLADLCRTVFSRGCILRDDEPSLSVSRGLAWAGETDLTSASLLGETKKSVKEGIAGTFDDLVGLLSTSFSSTLYTYAKDILTEWAKPEVSAKNLSMVQNELREGFQQYLGTPQAKRVTDTCFGAWLDSVRRILIDSVNQSFANRYPNSIHEIEPFDLNGEKWQAIKQILALDTTFQVPANAIDIDWNNLLTAFAYLVAFLGAPLWMLDDWLDLGVIDWVSDRFDEHEQKRVRSKADRAKVLRLYCEKKDDVLKKLGAQLAAAIKTSYEKCGAKFQTSKKERIIGAIYENVEADIEAAVDTISMYFER